MLNFSANRFICLIGITVLSWPVNATAQKKIIRKLFGQTSGNSREASFLPLPVIGYAQETGIELGILSLYSFYTDKTDTLTRNSSVTLLGSVTTHKQQNLKVSADIWMPGNRAHHVSELRFKNFPFNFYGTGDQTHKRDEDAVIQRSLKLSYEREYRIGAKAFAGFHGSFEQLRFLDKESGGIFGQQATTGGKVALLGGSFSFDDRNTNTYTTAGVFAKAGYGYAPGWFGSSSFRGGLLSLDLRSFTPFSKKIVFAAQAVAQRLGGDNRPFYVLPQLGNDQVMRGYYTGRYRDQGLFALQAEWRLRLSPRIGLAGFAGAGNVYGQNTAWFSGLKPSYGGGFRYFFDAERGLSIRMDYGFGEKRPGEERQKGFYLSLGEAF